MSYEISWKAGASRDMDRLPLLIASAVVEFIYEILETHVQVVVIAVQHRADAYR